MNFSSFFRNCKHCGLGISNNNFKGINFFCESCWIKLEKHKTPNNFLIYKTPEILVRSLFLWEEKKSIVRDLIHGLKGGTPFNVLEDLALELSGRYISDPESVVIPVPSSKVGEKDHAYLMGQIIAKDQNREFLNCLSWKNKHTNLKFLNKTERFVSEMKMANKLLPQKRVILIDDLVTTGATATAAFKAFRGLNPIEVWSLACRL